MATEPSGVGVWSPKIRDEALARKFVSQGGQGYVAVSIQDGATPKDPDADTLELTVWSNDVLATPPTSVSANNPYGTQVLVVTEPDIVRTDVGKYYYEIGPALTASRGVLTAVWTYQVDGTEFTFTDHLQVLNYMPTYDALSEQEKYVVEQVTWMFADLYDSTEGGPHLIEEFQTHWGYERIAQLQRLAVQKMNYIGNYGNPPTTWSVGLQATIDAGGSVSVSGGSSSSSSSSNGLVGGTEVPPNMAGLAVWGTYIEVLRHLRDSYTEIPDRPNMDVTYTDRRDYYTRWMGTLQSEEENFKLAVKGAKLSLLSLSRGSLLVAGGIYGGSALGIFQAGTYASQVRSWRFYPAAPAIAWGATGH